MNVRLRKLQFSETEAILLISLVNINVERLEILWSKVSDGVAEVMGHFLKKQCIQESERNFWCRH